MTTDDMNQQRSLVEQLQVLWGTEQAIVKALPSMIARVSDEGLKNVLRLHYAETLNQTSSLRGIFKQLELEPGGNFQSSFEEILREGQTITSSNERTYDVDLKVISLATKVESYEIDLYMQAIIEAGRQNLDGIEKILLVILNEEKLSLVKLNFLKRNIEELMSQPKAELVL
jgi:ferritin-like metal-binding protein YciE